MPDDTTLILQRLARIETLLETEAQRCPYQSDIARATNNIEERKKLAERVERVEEQQAERMNRIEEKLVDARISIAKMLGAGGAGGIVGTLLVELVKGLIETIP